MRKKVGAIEDDVLILAGLGIGGYLLYQKIFAPPSQQDTNTVTALATTPTQNNPFNYQYKYGLYAKDPSTYNQQWWYNLVVQYTGMVNANQNPAGVSGVYNYVTWGGIIYNAFGVFTIDLNAIESVIQAVHSQADISNIAAYLFFIDNIDLYALLSQGTGAGITIRSGLSTSDLATVINSVNNLPESN
jgi:hypothetical protein